MAVPFRFLCVMVEACKRVSLYAPTIALPITGSHIGLVANAFSARTLAFQQCNRIPIIVERHTIAFHRDNQLTVGFDCSGSTRNYSRHASANTKDPLRRLPHLAMVDL
jgi:hypothetical protein